MIEAICDKCGKRIVLEYGINGLKSPKDWNLVTQYFPQDMKIRYRTLCPECHESVKRVKE